MRQLKAALYILAVFCFLGPLVGMVFALPVFALLLLGGVSGMWPAFIAGCLEVCFTMVIANVPRIAGISERGYMRAIGALTRHGDSPQRWLILRCWGDGLASG